MMRFSIISGVLAATVVAGGVLAQEGPQNGSRKGSRNGARQEARNGALDGAPQELPQDDRDSARVMDSYKEMARQFVEEEQEQRELFIYTCRYIQGETLRSALDNFISPVGMLADCDEADKIVIYDDKDTIPVLRKIAEELDRPVPQVLVGARVVEFYVDSYFEKELALQYQKFAGISGLDSSTDFVDTLTDALVPSAPTLGSAGYMNYDSGEQDLLSGFLRFLESNGKSQILSAPNLILRRGVSGNILTGEDVPIVESSTTSSGISYSTKYKSVGVKLQVTPVMITDDYVRLEVSPEVSNITRYEETQSGISSPVIAVRNASTELVVRDGQLVSIGGLLREEVLEERSRVPILGSIPLLGSLFRSTTYDSVQSQLVIFLTTKILKDSDMTPALIQPSELSDELQEQVDKIEQTMPEKSHSMGEDVRKFLE